MGSLRRGMAASPCCILTPLPTVCLPASTHQPTNQQVVNPSYDYLPPELISLFVTGAGWWRVGAGGGAGLACKQAGWLETRGRLAYPLRACWGPGPSQPPPWRYQLSVCSLPRLPCSCRSPKSTPPPPQTHPHPPPPTPIPTPLTCHRPRQWLHALIRVPPAVRVLPQAGLHPGQAANGPADWLMHMLQC